MLGLAAELLTPTTLSARAGSHSSTRSSTMAATEARVSIKSLKLLCYIKLRVSGYYESQLRKVIGPESVARLERHVTICNGVRGIKPRHVVPKGMGSWTEYVVYWKKATAPGKKATKHSFPLTKCVECSLAENAV